MTDGHTLVPSQTAAGPGLKAAKHILGHSQNLKNGLMSISREPATWTC